MAKLARSESSTKEKTMKAIVVVSTIVLCLAVGEFALRYFTVFPISRDSNQVDDARLGYRLPPSFPGIDSYGFRNEERARAAYEVATIGDSHTYGYHVAAEDSWPSVFSRLTDVRTYNFAVPSYNIFTYHALIDEALKDGPRAIIVGLYPANDFTGSEIICRKGADTEYWRAQFVDLDLDGPRVPNQCRGGGGGGPKSLDRYLNQSAIFSAFNHLILKQVTVSSRRSRFLADAMLFFHNLSYTFGIPVDGVVEDQFYRFPGDVFPISKKRITVVDDREIEMLANFKKMAASWHSKTRARDVKLGVLIIPSRSQIVYRYLEQQGLAGSVDPSFRKNIESQNAFDRAIESILDEVGIPYQEAASDAAVAMGEAMSEGRNFFPAMDAHPLEDGYRGYAVAATRLWETMSKQP